MRRATVLCLAALAVATALPATAGAASLTLAGGVLTVSAGPGHDNNLVAVQSNSGRVVVSRQGLDDDPLTALGCEEVFPGTQYVCAGVSRVVVYAGDGDDVVNVNGLSGIPATLVGADGDDRLTGGAASDSLEGGAGDDTLRAGVGDDTLTGGAGDDELLGEAGDDVLAGGDGDDELSGAGGADALSGGAGIDGVTYTGGDQAVNVSLDGAADDGVPGERDNVAPDVEDVSAGTAAVAPVTIVGNDGGNELTATGGPATLTGGGGSDILAGGPQDDVLYARDGFADRVSCGAGADVAVVDPLDTVAADCETVQSQPVVGGADDRPPTVAWSAPAASATVSGDAGTTLAVTAADDRGVAAVRFYDGDRLLCEDLAAPYTCPFAPRGSDVGRGTLIATAVDSGNQSASAVRTVTVGRLGTRGLSLSVSPARDRRTPYRFTARGRLALPAAVRPADGCAGQSVTLTAKAGSRTVSTRRAGLSSACTYRLTVAFRHRPAARLRFSARFGGSGVLRPRSARTRVVHTR